MRRAAVFSGTKEGQEVCRILCQKGVFVTAFVETEAGEAQIEPGQRLAVVRGKLLSDGMEEILESYEVIVDAACPSGSQAASIQTVCRKLEKPYLYVLCESLRVKNGIYVESVEKAADYLNCHEGNALLSIGSSNLEPFHKIKGFKERLTVRVMPTIDDILTCNMAGFFGKQILAVEDSFSIKLNQIQLEELGAKYLVVKEDGGRFSEKAEAARLAGAGLIVIQNPLAKRGQTVEETVDLALQFLCISE